MKKLVSLAIVLVMIFSFSACKGGNPYKKITDEQIKDKISTGDLGELPCYYSIENEDRTDEEFVVHFPDDVYDSEKDVFYDKDNDTHVLFFGDKVFYDEETGKVVEEKDIEYGQMLKIIYNGEAYKKDPLTIKAVKVLICD